MAGGLPSGTVTFLFTDVEGSTRLLHDLGEEKYANALTEHRRIVREQVAAHGGVEVDTQGDAFFVAFPTAPAALKAAAAARDALADGPIRIRVGLHTGTPLLTDEGYVGHDVHRAARIAAAGHGGQVLVSASTASLLATDGLRDLGQHRLKDLSAPERIYQLGDEEFPPLKSLHQTNLPIPATQFLGREREVAEIRGLLARDDFRLVTLTGPGGSGKTRLALQASADAADAFDAGVWWVPLAPLRDPSLVPEVAASALGAKTELADHIGDKRLLLLFDNFEHVLDAASGIAHLLERCHRLTVLVTSREPLHLDGEWEYAVDPLDEAEAVALFELRARAVKRDFAANGKTREICARLDNLPLAIELAAARVKVLSPQVLLERLEQRLPILTAASRAAPERQRTLRATIEWSHDLLVVNEQQLFARLAVFRGGCTLQAAEAVCDADLDTLQSLVDKSLVRVRVDERFWMLETIREFAEERLTASGESDELRRRHAEHFLALAEEEEPNLLARPQDSLAVLDREQDNLRAALDWFEATHETQDALRLAGALWKYWYQRGLAAEGDRRLETALKADNRETTARGRALDGATALAHLLNDPAKARTRAEEGLALQHRLADPWGIANSLQLLGNAEARDGNYDKARELHEEALRRFQELGDNHFILLSMQQLAWANYELGDRSRARELLAEVVRRARTSGNLRMEARSLGSLAEYELIDGRVREALPKLERSYNASTDLREIGANVSRFARALALAQKFDLSARLLASAEALHEDAGATNYLWIEHLNEETVAMIKSELDDVAFAQAWQQGRRLAPDEAVALAVNALEEH